MYTYYVCILTYYNLTPPTSIIFPQTFLHLPASQNPTTNIPRHPKTSIPNLPVPNSCSLRSLSFLASEFSESKPGMGHVSDGFRW